METVKETQPDRKPYEPPAVVYETTLDTRAGSPLGVADPLDLSGTGK